MKIFEKIKESLKPNEESKSFANWIITRNRYSLYSFIIKIEARKQYRKKGMSKQVRRRRLQNLRQHVRAEKKSLLMLSIRYTGDEFWDRFVAKLDILHELSDVPCEHMTKKSVEINYTEFEVVTGKKPKFIVKFQCPQCSSFSQIQIQKRRFIKKKCSNCKRKLKVWTEQAFKFEKMKHQVLFGEY